MLPIYRRVVQRLFFSSECKLIFKTASLIQNTVQFHENILFYWLGFIWKLMKLTISSFVNTQPPTHPLICSFVRAFLPGVHQSFILRFQHQFILLGSTPFVETDQSPGELSQPGGLRAGPGHLCPSVYCSGNPRTGRDRTSEGKGEISKGDVALIGGVCLLSCPWKFNFSS